MPIINDAFAKKVSSKFLTQYYNLIHDNPENIGVFFQDESVATRNYVSTGAIYTQKGKDNIVNEQELHFPKAGCGVHCSSFSWSVSGEENILITAVGTFVTTGISSQDDIPFVQTFLLAKEGGSSYFLLNDMLIFLPRKVESNNPREKVENAHSHPSTRNDAHGERPISPKKSAMEAGTTGTKLSGEVGTASKFSPESVRKSSAENLTAREVRSPKSKKGSAEVGPSEVKSVYSAAKSVSPSVGPSSPPRVSAKEVHEREERERVEREREEREREEREKEEREKRQEEERRNASRNKQAKKEEKRFVSNVTYDENSWAGRLFANPANIEYAANNTKNIKVAEAPHVTPTTTTTHSNTRQERSHANVHANAADTGANVRQKSASKYTFVRKGPRDDQKIITGISQNLKTGEAVKIYRPNPERNFFFLEFSSAETANEAIGLDRIFLDNLNFIKCEVTDFVPLVRNENRRPPHSVNRIATSEKK